MALTKRSQSIADLKTKLANQGKKYTAEALAYRDKIAELTLGFIKDDSVVCGHCHTILLDSASCPFLHRF